MKTMNIMTQEIDELTLRDRLEDLLYFTRKK